MLGEPCDLDLWPHSWPCSFKVKVWNSIIWGKWGRLIDMERKGCELIIHDHDCDLWVALVGWVDVPYSDWGDFRRRRAVDISSCFWSVSASAAAVLPTLFNFLGKPLKLISSNHTWLTYGCGKKFWHPFCDFGSMSLSYQSGTQFTLSPR